MPFNVAFALPVGEAIYRPLHGAPVGSFSISLFDGGNFVAQREGLFTRHSIEVTTFSALQVNEDRHDNAYGIIFEHPEIKVEPCQASPAANMDNWEPGDLIEHRGKIMLVALDPDSEILVAFSLRKLGEAIDRNRPAILYKGWSLWFEGQLLFTKLARQQ